MSIDGLINAYYEVRDLVNFVHGYNVDSLNFETLATLPGFVYVKSIKSIYLWANFNLSKAAVGKEVADAMKGSTDFDFHWNLYAEQMRENDKQVIETCLPVHATETSQRPDGIVHRLTSYKVPLYKKGTLMGLLGISSERPISRFQTRLTPREQTCIALMAQGMVDKEIANKLNISRRTVEFHFNNSKTKLNVCSRAELIVLFCEK